MIHFNLLVVRYFPLNVSLSIVDVPCTNRFPELFLVSEEHKTVRISGSCAGSMVQQAFCIMFIHCTDCSIPSHSGAAVKYPHFIYFPHHVHGEHTSHSATTIKFTLWETIRSQRIKWPKTASKVWEIKHNSQVIMGNHFICDTVIMKISTKQAGAVIMLSTSTWKVPGSNHCPDWHFSGFPQYVLIIKRTVSWNTLYLYPSRTTSMHHSHLLFQIK